MTTTTCEKCGKTFTHHKERSAKFALSMHMSRTHGIRPANSKPSKSRAKQPTTSDQEQQVALRFCPCCGASIALIYRAMQLANKLGKTN